MTQPAKGMQILRDITSFDERIEAAKIIARAIEDGVLDDAGDIAEITPQQFAVEDGDIVGVIVRIVASEPMDEGHLVCGRFERKVTPLQPIDGVEPRRFKRRGKDMIETTALIPTKAA